MKTDPYDSFFFQSQRNHDGGAGVIARLLVGLFNPKSVVDVGCGVGQMVSALKSAGVTSVIGIDGPWVPRDMLLFPSDDFHVVDLTKPNFDRSCDLAICLEVAEHLPARVADSFVGFLTTLAPVIAFSAAIPYQGGVNHVNEQWPSYWARLFKERGYIPLDCLRGHLLADSRVATCYQTNLIVYIRQKQYAAFSVEAQKEIQGQIYPLPVVHPLVYESLSKLAKDPLTRQGFLKVIGALPRLFLQGARRRLSSLFPGHRI